MKKYKIGQVLFVVPKDKAAIVPVKVIEEVVKKSSKGEATVYTVTWQSGAENKQGSLEQVAGEVFDSPAKVKRALAKRAIEALDAALSNACEKAHRLYGYELRTSQAKLPRPSKAQPELPVATQDEGDSEPEIQVDEKGEFANVRMVDGSTARLRL